jgi:DNA-directed RNA polymerase specialized sigma24 family protein
MTEVVDLLPRDAELARRAAGGDGAAFVRLYDTYSPEVFASTLAAIGSVEAAAEATQKAFLRLLRWPPRFGAPDEDVAELLFALAHGGRTHPRGAAPAVTRVLAADATAFGWLRSETVANAGARFDADWSIHLWHPDAEPEPEPAPEPEPVPEVARRRPRRRLRIPRLSPRFPAPAATAALVLAVFVGAAGTMLASGGTEPMEAAPNAAPAASEPERAELRGDGRARRHGWGTTKLLRNKTLEPLLAP